ncbi:MAG: hypothetical protein Q8Q32_02275 [bacterium]|nr:hypothetical protein [bacterium]
MLGNLEVLAEDIVSRPAQNFLGKEGHALRACLWEILYFLEDLSAGRQVRDMKGVFSAELLPVIQAYSKRRSVQRTLVRYFYDRIYSILLDKDALEEFVPDDFPRKMDQLEVLWRQTC